MDDRGKESRFFHQVHMNQVKCKYFTFQKNRDSYGDYQIYDVIKGEYINIVMSEQELADELAEKACFFEQVRIPLPPEEPDIIYYCANFIQNSFKYFWEIQSDMGDLTGQELHKLGVMALYIYHGMDSDIREDQLRYLTGRLAEEFYEYIRRRTGFVISVQEADLYKLCGFLFARAC